MKKIATDSIKATYAKVDSFKTVNVFEVNKFIIRKLFGLDFMIDDNFDPWLIEINTNPAITVVCPLAERIFPTLLENVFR